MAIHDLKAFNKAFTSVTTSANKMKPVLHDMAMFAAQQILKHRNSDPAMRMFGLPGTVNIKGLAQWLVEFLPVAVASGEVKVFAEKNLAWVEAVKDIPATLEKANATPFWEFHTGATISAKPTNYRVELEKIIAKAMLDLTAEGAADMVAIYNAMSPEQKEAIDKRVTSAESRKAKQENKA
jgi:hypothetical protein